MAMHAGTQVATPVILHCQDFTVPLMLLVSCRVHNTQKKNELEKLEKTAEDSRPEAQQRRPPA